MITSADDLWLVAIAWRLDRLRWVPRAVLRSIVTSRGACMTCTESEPPAWLDTEPTDRALAARLCAGCGVRDECLELELRESGDGTVGVWGGLSETDRRALVWHWRQRGERAASEADPAGGLGDG